MKISLKCACGAEATFEGGTFINQGGRADQKGRTFTVELRADEWTEAHKTHHIPPFTGKK